MLEKHGPKIIAYIYDTGIDLPVLDMQDLSSLLDSAGWGDTVEEAYKNSYDKSHEKDALYKIEVIITSVTSSEEITEPA